MLLLGSVIAHAAPLVTLSRERYLSLAFPEAPATPPSPDPLVARRDVVVETRDEGLDLDVSWVVQVPGGPRRVRLVLAGPSVRVSRVTLNGRVVPVAQDAAGTVLAVDLARTSRITMQASAARDGALPLLPAAAGSVTHPADLHVQGVIPVGPRSAVGGGPVVTFGARSAAAPDRDLLIGASALGVTVGDAEIEVRGIVRFTVAGRAVQMVAFDVPGAGSDLDVRGPQIAQWHREGDRVEVALRQPERALVSFAVSWSLPSPRAEATTLPVPRLVPAQVFKASAAVQLARESELDVIPDLDRWTAIPATELPPWGRGLVAGTSVGAFTGQGDPATISILRFSPANGPPTIIDVAAFSGIVTEEGRCLLRATYAVRNDRSAVLRIEPPPGFAPIGAKVSGKTATLARDEQTWFVPLEKSVETVEGLLAFPVEVLFVGRQSAWNLRRGATFPLPSVDAEVAVARLSLRLPRDWVARTKVGTGDVVEQFTAGESVTYGYAVGDTRAAAAEVLFQEAVDAWKRNDFRSTSDKLDELEQMGAKSGEIERLQSNIEVVEGGASGLAERRVLEQARARSVDDALRQEKALEEADEAYAAGEYEEAEKAYQDALRLGEDLAKLRNEEDQEQVQVNREVASKLENARTVRSQKDVQKKGNAVQPASGVGATTDGTVQFDADLDMPPAVADIPAASLLLGGVGVESEVLAPEEITVKTGKEEPKPVITASAVGVVLPAGGAEVYYQTLLLPPGAPWEVSIRAKPVSPRAR